MPKYRCHVCKQYCEVPRYTFKGAEPTLCSVDCLKFYLKDSIYPWVARSFEINGRKSTHFRSNYEVLFAHFLQENGIKFQYEKRAVELGDYDFYIPDFFIPDSHLYVEIKGRLDRRGKHKVRNFLKQYPYSLLYLDGKALTRFKII
jgi:hypothetical protein